MKRSIMINLHILREMRIMSSLIDDSIDTGSEFILKKLDLLEIIFGSGLHDHFLNKILMHRLESFYRI